MSSPSFLYFISTCCFTCCIIIITTTNVIGISTAVPTYWSGGKGRGKRQSSLFAAFQSPSVFIKAEKMIPMSSSLRATMGRHVGNNDESSMRDESKRGTFADDGTTNDSSSSSSLRQAIEELAIIIERTHALPPADSPLNSSPKNMESTKTATSYSTTRSSSSSIVHIIGTGLNPTLLNLPLSTLLLLSRADVVFYDSLGLNIADITHIVPAHCEIICVGKRGDQKSNSWKQDDINELLLQKSIEPSSFTNQEREQQQQQQQQRSIVRLKGGDPFLFGRARTEINTLQANNILYTYTPGISSCIAGPHLGGIPLTDASLNCQSFGVWSGTDAFGCSRGLDRNDAAADDDDDNDNDSDSGKQQLQQSNLLSVDTLVFLMIGRLDKLDALCQYIAKQHGDNGNDEKWNTNTPCAIIQNAGGTRLDSIQKVWRSTLGKLVSDIKEEDPIRVSVSPAVLVVGATATLDLLSQEY